jgi:glutaminyl-tRNA synthetase
VLWIEQDDFRETPPPKYFRLSPGVEVRLRAAYVVKCTGLTKDPATGEVTEVRCTYDPDTRGGEVKGRKIKSTIHWVSAAHAVEAEVRLYDTLFTVPKPDEAPDFKSVINPKSLEVVGGVKVEPALAEAAPEDHVQFERVGYFVADWKDHRPGHPVFNRSVGLRDTWARIEKAAG